MAKPIARGGSKPAGPPLLAPPSVSISVSDAEVD
jgi:hypothetical protein